MKKIVISFIFVTSLFSLGGCTSLDVTPVSSITDDSYWKTPDHFDAFMNGLHTRFREGSFNYFLLGEARSDVFGDQPFGGEASQGMERLPYNTLNEENPVISNYGRFYENINQLNLMIYKILHTDNLTEAAGNYYLGQAYGMRAYYYFHLLRSWGDAIITTEPTEQLDLTNLAKAASPADDVMKFIKNDIDESVKCFGSDYTIKGRKAFWSKAATLMLKGEVYLWSAKQMGGGTGDANIAKAALTDIRQNVPDLGLMENYKDVFAYSQKGNKEIIFAMRSELKEFDMWNGSFGGNLLPYAATLATYYDASTGEKFDISKENLSGLMRLGIKKTNLARFDDKDSRKRGSLNGAYNKLEDGSLDLIGAYCYKYQGTQDAGSTRSNVDDYPIYRYADLLLLLAEAKVMLGENPADEINQIRRRAYGENYDEATIGFPNQAIDKDVNEALLEERFKEFLIEGKRWYDLRRFGSEYVFKYTLAESGNEKKLLWPIDKSTLTNNTALKQTPGYETSGS
nr:SusD family outer membrane lipoprotein NanU [Parabacteroides goldsteinii]